MGIVAPESPVNCGIGVTENEVVSRGESEHCVVRKLRASLENVTTLELEVVPLIGRARNITNDCSKHYLYSANVRGLAPATGSAPPIQVEVCRYPQNPTTRYRERPSDSG